MGRRAVLISQRGRSVVLESMRSAHRQCNLRGREGACRVIGSASYLAISCSFARGTLVIQSTLRRSIRAGALGCDSAVEENGYPLGSNSFVSTDSRSARSCAGHCFYSFECGIVGRFAFAAAPSAAVAPLPLVRFVGFRTGFMPVR